MSDSFLIALMISFLIYLKKTLQIWDVVSILELLEFVAYEAKFVDILTK